MLFESLKGLEAASAPQFPTESGNNISNELKRLTWCTAREIRGVLNTVIVLIGAEGKSREIQALRYREALEEIEDLNKLGPRNHPFLELEITVLSKLIALYEEQDNAPTVRRFSKMRSSLPSISFTGPDPKHVAHSAQCFLNATGKISKLLDRLDLRIEPPLHATNVPLFPALQDAFRCGLDEVASLLCDLPGALQHTDALGQDPVLAAAAAGKIALLEPHIQKDSSLLQNRDLFKRTALFHTAFCGPLKSFISLYEAGANILDRDSAGQSILGAACAAGNLDIVRWLLDRSDGPSANDHYFGSRSPLHDAARAGHTAVCLLLLEKGALVNYVVDDMTPAQAARGSGFNELGDILELSASNFYSLNSTFGTPGIQTQPDGRADIVPQSANMFECPTYLPFELGSLDFDAETSRIFNLSESPLTNSPNLGGSRGGVEHASTRNSNTDLPFTTT
jgi:ankyrin repeat protein